MTAGFGVHTLQGSSEGELTTLARIESNAFQPKQTGIFFCSSSERFPLYQYNFRREKEPKEWVQPLGFWLPGTGLEGLTAALKL